VECAPGSVWPCALIAPFALHHAPVALPATVERLVLTPLNRLTWCAASHIFNHMVENAAMNDVFHALAHDVRRAMLTRLASGELTVGQLAEPFTVSLEATSKHIRVLERAGLVRRTVEGRRHVCRLSPKPLASAYDWLRFYERFWNARLDALEGHFAPTPKKKGKKR
jgi:DNA-binding transcriptional ArsR family regulator